MKRVKSHSHFEYIPDFKKFPQKIIIFLSIQSYNSISSYALNFSNVINDDKIREEDRHKQEQQQQQKQWKAVYGEQGVRRRRRPTAASVGLKLKKKRTSPT